MTSAIESGCELVLQRERHFARERVWTAMKSTAPSKVANNIWRNLRRL